jgi:Na+-transporting NADH:ubiquinone oxidoreductase subunit NqrD
MVRVSARASTTQEANQLGGAVIMPLILGAVGQTTGLLLLDPEWILLGGAIIWIVAWLLIRGGMRRFQRDQIAMQL